MGELLTAETTTTTTPAAGGRDRRTMGRLTPGSWARCWVEATAEDATAAGGETSPARGGRRDKVLWSGKSPRWRKQQQLRLQLWISQQQLPKQQLSQQQLPQQQLSQQQLSASVPV